MLRISSILRRLTPPRRFWAGLAVLALLINSASMGLHHSQVLAAAAASEMACADFERADDTAHESDDASHPVPGHPGLRCPFCILIDSGKVLPPSVCLIFPPAPMPAAYAPPDVERLPSTTRVAAHAPRGPPAGN
jgi:hypothetical protein